MSQESIVMTAVAFEHTRVETSRVALSGPADSYEAAEEAIRRLPHDGLTHVFLLSDGLRANASRVVQGAQSALPPGVGLTGGCAADGDRMKETQVWSNSDPGSCVAAFGLYGDRLLVNAATTGPWGPFGPDRLITRSKDNMLYELDGLPALDVYKAYLGEHAAQLPASALLFPLLLHEPGSQRCVLRAILGINDADQSILFAGDVPEGYYARLMRGTIERLLDGVFETASSIRDNLHYPSPDLSILVSCNGRRHVLKQRIEEEIEVLQDVLGLSAAVTGFYSYGEIGPVSPGEPSELHNETMSITTLAEK